MKNANSNPNQLSIFEQQKLLDPSLSDRQAVLAICERLLKEADAAPPVNVELLASLRGIVRIEEHEQEYAGMLIHQPEGMVAHIRASDALARQRFTILHEAGHTLLPGYGQASQYRCGGPRSWEEQLSDLAAGELLFPRNEFSADLARAGLGMASAEALAARYGASVEASAVREVDVWPDDVLMLVLKIANKPSEMVADTQPVPKLRLAWSYGKGDWPFVRQHKSVNEDSVFVRAHKGELIEETSELGELARESVGPVRVSAKRYGPHGRVLALISKCSATRAQGRRAR
jgi:Zn-dependent peptidase ImmA (M78 family)